MAYNQAPSRSPLIDKSMKEALEKRGVELLGLILTMIGISIFLLLWSYSPDDRSFWSISDEPTQNILGVYRRINSCTAHTHFGLGKFYYFSFPGNLGCKIFMSYRRRACYYADDFFPSINGVFLCFFCDLSSL